MRRSIHEDAAPRRALLPGRIGVAAGLCFVVPFGAARKPSADWRSQSRSRCSGGRPVATRPRPGGNEPLTWWPWAPPQEEPPPVRLAPPRPPLRYRACQPEPNANHWDTAEGRTPVKQPQFDRLLESYPELRGIVRGRDTTFVPFDGRLASTLAGSAYVIPFTSNGHCLMTRRKNGKWVLPGGTIEPEETWEAAAHREIMEETGCRLLNLNPFGMYKCVSHDASPRLPHIPHPVHYRVIAWSDVERTGSASDKSTTAQITEVRAVKLEKTQELFDPTDQDFAAFYRLADYLRSKDKAPT